MFFLPSIWWAVLCSVLSFFVASALTVHRFGFIWQQRMRRRARFSSYLHMVLYEGWLFGWFVGCVSTTLLLLLELIFLPPLPPPSSSPLSSLLLLMLPYHLVYCVGDFISGVAWAASGCARGLRRNKAHLSSLKLYKIIFRCRVFLFGSVSGGIACALLVHRHRRCLCHFAFFNIIALPLMYTPVPVASREHPWPEHQSSHTLPYTFVRCLSARQWQEWVSRQSVKQGYVRLFAYYYWNTPEITRMYSNSQHCVNYRLIQNFVGVS